MGSDLNGDLTVHEYAELWLREVKARSKPTTERRYREVYRYHVSTPFGGRNLRTITRFELKQFLAEKIASGLHPKMLTTVLSALFSQALEDGFVEANPAFGLGRYFHTNRRDEDIKVFTEDELSRFLEAAASQPLYEGLFRTMAYAGLRLGEARALRCRDVFYRDEKLDVVRTFSADTLSVSTKNHKARRIEIPAALAEELYASTKRFDSEDWLFDRAGDFLRERACQYGFRDIARKARLPKHLQSKTHALRHTYATRLLERGASLPYLQRQLGHHSIKLTNDTYGRWAQLSDRRAINRFMSDTDTRHELAELGGALEEEENAGAKVLRFHRGSAPTYVSPSTVANAQFGTKSSPDADSEDGA